jgi:hypothetical protein
VWLKVPEADFAFEGRALELLRPVAPDVVPEVLAWERDRGWLVLADEGDEAEKVDWRAVLRRYGRLQRDSAPLADALVEAGVDDYRGPLLAERIEELVPGNTRAQELCARLAESPVPPAAEHRDLRAAHVRHDRVILDWGDMSVAHPFLSIAWGDPWRNRAAYLEGFPADPGAVEAARDLRALWGALNWSRVLPYDPSLAADVRNLVARF